ncbi:MAG: hypothetical protein GY803_05025 [Chloroflexi bacterium]|nr:hypothetical protein [Chloroflexota bacterium]
MIEYEANQNRIYENDFRAKAQSLSKVKTAPCVVEPTAGYIVAWLYPDSYMDKVSLFNGRINNIAPTIRFDKNNAHTTITVYQKQSAADFQPNEQILESLTVAGHSLDEQLLQTVRIDFKEWLFNQEAVIAAGQPNAAFWQAGEALQAAGKANDLNLRMPWGAHITTARYLTDSTNISELTTLTRQTPRLGESQPHAIVVGHFICGPRELRLAAHAIRRIR